MPRPFLFLLAVTLWVGGCGDGQSGIGEGPMERVATAERALGVPKDGFPNWEERVILVLTNRARNDPAAQSAESCNGGCASYPSSKPLYHNYNLGRAARFQATSLKKAGAGLQHDSVCRIVSNIADRVASG